jgi:hypothetical protein
MTCLLFTGTILGEVYQFAPKENTTIQHLVGGDRMFLVCISAEKATHGFVGMFGPFEVRADTIP